MLVGVVHWHHSWVGLLVSFLFWRLVWYLLGTAKISPQGGDINVISRLQTSVIFTPQQGNFSLQQTETTIENHNDSQCGFVEHSISGSIQTKTTPKDREIVRAT